MIKLRHLVHARAGTSGVKKTVLSGSPQVKAPTAMTASRQKVEANFPGSMNGQQMQLAVNGGQQYDTLLAGIVSDDDSGNYRFYRDIYRYDNTSGAAVDLLSILPFSDYELIGSTEERNLTYQTAVERLNLKTALPSMSVEYYTMGKFIGTLMYRSDRRQFTELMPHRAEDSKITPSPFFGIEPSIEVSQSETVRQFLSSDDPRFVRMRQTLNPQFLRALQASSMLLDSSTTLYVPRMSEATGLGGMSLYKRILPIYLIEKALYKGTLIEAQRRQRSLLHLEVGDEEWEATAEELQAIVSLFQQSDLDPLGAIIATRAGVVPNELRQGGDFWKWTDMTDQLSQMKLRALTISETFLSGEANYASMEVSLSVFLDSLNNHRDTFTQEVFYNKAFPIIAVTNGFYKDGVSHQVAAGIREQMKMQYRIADTSKLDIPSVQWKKQLKPQANKDYMDALSQLEEKGLPIGLRMWAAAGGLDAESLVQQAEEEKGLRKRVADLKKQTGEGESAEEEGGEFASLAGRLGLSKFGEEVSEIVGRSKTGKRQYIPNQKQAVSRQHQLAASALSRLSQTYVPPKDRK